MPNFLLDMLIIVPPDFIYQPLGQTTPTYSEENYLPYGALSLAAYLVRHGQRAMVAPLQTFYQKSGRYDFFDAGTAAAEERFEAKTAEVLGALIERLRPRTIGLSINYALHHRSAQIVLDCLRRRWPELPVLAGGVHATTTADQWLGRDRPVDALALGEGETSCLAWLRLEGDGRGVAGLALPGRPAHRRPDPLDRQGISVPVDLALAALPRWQPLNGFRHLIATSRGCSHRCAFCSSHRMWRSRRRRAISAVEQEIEAIAGTGVDRCLFADDMLDPGAQSFGRLAEVLSRAEGLRFGAPLRLDCLEDLDPLKLARARIDQVFIGLESFVPEVLAVMNKRLRAGPLGKLEVVLERLRDAGVGSTLFMIVGHPGSSYDFDRLSLERCRRLAEAGLLAGLSAVHVAPYPGTALAEMESEGRFRTIEHRMNRWTLSEPIIELLDPHGRVTYRAEQMGRVFEGYLDLWRLCQEHGNRLAPGPAEL